jgi:hypothetical protein
VFTYIMCRRYQCAHVQINKMDLKKNLKLKTSGNLHVWAHLHCKSASPLYKHMFGFFQIYSSYLETSEFPVEKTNSSLGEAKFMFIGPS